jgi:hypothetical protein
MKIRINLLNFKLLDLKDLKYVYIQLMKMNLFKNMLKIFKTSVNNCDKNNQMSPISLIAFSNFKTNAVQTYS